MNRKQALIELRDKVKVGGLTNDEPNVPPSLYGQWGYMIHAQRGSLDAAKALHDALLPGWEWRLGPSNAKIYPFNGSPEWYGMADTPARAWLLAIIEVLIAREVNE